MTPDEIIKNLPKPHTVEEQYYYALALAAAGTKYEAPYDKPFWRIQQYLYAWWQVTALRMHEMNVPDDGTVSSGKIVDGAVTGEKVAVGAITLDKLADEVADRLLAGGRVTEEMLASAVREKLLGTGRVTNAMIADGSVTTAKIADRAVTSAKIADGVIPAAAAQ